MLPVGERYRYVKLAGKRAMQLTHPAPRWASSESLLQAMLNSKILGSKQRQYALHSLLYYTLGCFEPRNAYNTRDPGRPSGPRYTSDMAEKSLCLG
jgi:hypothetical protein